MIGMDEYIRREEAIDAVLDAYFNTSKINLIGKLFYNAILKLQPADVAPVKHGRWIGIPLCGNDDCECSECGNWCNIHVNLCGEAIQKYCPYCGAKMDGGANNTVG